MMHGRTPDNALTELLVLDAQSGASRALTRLYDIWAPRLHRHAARLTGDSQGALDVSQDSWLAIVKGLRRLDDPALFGPWAYRIVTRRAADWTRARQADRRLHDAARRSTVQPSEPTDDTEALRLAIRDLAPDQRAILSMHHADGLSLAHIARSLQVPVGTVKSRLHAARAELRRVLEQRTHQGTTS